ncbi:dihydrodipicolinate synthase family protein [Saccharolobus solfataricus]|uniref:Dihydrodipicolinate synthetase n=1 Tax=Saccharolobus solfataricus TaxID=2287 RepID=A0A157T613_SACSO|nr:dihydrodipicolinate synthase family protein [Saccharolobus solfataricus]SAI86719.1 dihydrodipicolinate synthetase [Saccharolobus solfataricus]
MRLEGVVVPLITPFLEDYSIDKEGLKWLVSYLSENGVNGIFVNSSVGEFASLTLDEMKLVAKIALDSRRSDNTLIFAGASTNFTEETIKLAKDFKDMGVDAIVVMAPYFFKVREKELLNHFSMIAEKVDIPLIIYNIPLFTGINIPIFVYKTLVSQYSNIIGTKVTLDSLIFFKQLISEIREIRKDFSILTGFDEYLLPLLYMGGNGGVMGLANAIPKLHLKVYESWKNGNLSDANKYWVDVLNITDIYDYCNSYTASIKLLLKVLNMPIKNVVRPPLTICEEENKIRERIKDLSLFLTNSK